MSSFTNVNEFCSPCEVGMLTLSEQSVISTLVRWLEIAAAVRVVASSALWGRKPLSPAKRMTRSS